MSTDAVGISRELELPPCDTDPSGSAEPSDESELLELPPRLRCWDHVRGSLRARFATTAGDLEAALRLRTRVFSSSGSSDRDAFDSYCHHLVVVDDRNQAVVGTYRLMTLEQAERGPGFYSATEFPTQDLPDRIRAQGVELGRACVAPNRRGSAALTLLFAGIATYIEVCEKRFLFGCASVPTLDPHEVESLRRQLSQRNALHPDLWLPANPPYDRGGSSDMTFPPTLAPTLPPLLDRYLSLGAKLCGGPAFDTGFGVTDFLIVLDAHLLSTGERRRYAEARP